MWQFRTIATIKCPGFTIYQGLDTCDERKGHPFINTSSNRGGEPSDPN